MPPTLAEIRAEFPGLARPTALLDNAGGAQLPRCVIDAVTRYLAHDYVQVGADYDVSRRATANLARAHALAKVLVNAGDGDEAGPGAGVGEVVLGASTTALCSMLAGAYAEALGAGTLPPGRREIIVCTGGHEANVGPWLRLASRGFDVTCWPAERDDDGVFRARPSTLGRLVSERTLLVAAVHVSNILGEVYDLRAVCDVAHAHGARVVADGVAFAPHRAIDVRAWGVDWYVFSLYKVYGPHMAALYGARGAMEGLPTPNHSFIGRGAGAYAFEPGNVNHESAAGFNGLPCYLRFLAGEGASCDEHGAGVSRAVVERALGVMAGMEDPLQARLLAYLRAKPGVRVMGPAHPSAARVPTISFVREGVSSRQIAERACARGVGIRHGHFYSRRLCEQMGLEPDDGVVRASLVHYNAPAEVDRLCAVLDELL